MPRESIKCREWEKERRIRLSEGFLTLCKLLPCYDPSISTSKLDILKNAAIYINELQAKIKELIENNGEEVKKVKSEEYKKLHDRIKRLLTKNEQLCTLLRDAKISIPTGCSMVKKFRSPTCWTNKISPDQAKILQKKEAEKENDVTPKKMPRIFSNKKQNKVGGQNSTPKHRKAILNRSDSKKNRPCKKKIVKPLASSKCVIVLSQPSMTQSCYVITNAPSNNILGGTSTDSGLVTNPLVSSKAAKTVSSIPSLGPGTLILANGTIMPVLPQQTVLPLASQIITRPPIILLPKNSSVTISGSTTSVSVSTPRSKIVSSSVKTLSRIKPKYCLTKTTQVNKVPIPALTSRYSDPKVVLKKSEPKVVVETKVIEKKSVIKDVEKTTEVIETGEKRKAEVSQGDVSEVKKAKIVEESNTEVEKEQTQEGALQNILIEATATSEKRNEQEMVKEVEKETEEVSKATEVETKKSEETLDLNLNHSELSNDIFASLQVPTGCQNPESTSPTAAFLLAFPLVSSLTGVKVTEVTEEDNTESQRETPTLLQIGTIDNTKPTQSETLTPSLLNLDNLSFFSSKDIGGFYNSFETTSTASTIVTTQSTVSKSGTKDANQVHQKKVEYPQQQRQLQQIQQPVQQPQPSRLTHQPQSIHKQQSLQQQQTIQPHSHSSLQQQQPQASLQQPQSSLQQPHPSLPQQQQQPVLHQKKSQPLQQQPQQILPQSHTTLQKKSQQSLQQQSQPPLQQQPQPPLQQQSQPSLQQQSQPSLQQQSQPSLQQQSQSSLQQKPQPSLQQKPQPSLQQQSQAPLQQQPQPSLPQQPQSSLQQQSQPSLQQQPQQHRQEKNRLIPCFDNHNIMPPFGPTISTNSITQPISYQPKPIENPEAKQQILCANTYNPKSFTFNTFNEPSKVNTTCSYPNKCYPEPLYTNSSTYTYGNSDTNFNQNYYKDVQKGDNRNYYSLNYENYADYRKNDTNSYFPASNYYSNTNYSKDKFNTNTSNNQKTKNGTQMRPPINWMTTPDNRLQTPTDYVLPQFTKETEFYPSNTFTNTQTTYFNTNPMHPSNTNEAISTITNQEPRKSLDLSLVPPVNTYQRNEVEDNQFSWSPTKIPQFLDPPHTFTSSTLPTLVGDLALGNPLTFGEQKDKCQKKDRRLKNYESGNQSNFLSVSQLVDPNKEAVPSRTTTRRNSGGRSSGKKVPQKSSQRKEKDVFPQNKVESNSGKGMKQLNYSTELFCDSNKNRAKNNYSAEALIGHQMQSDGNQKRQQNYNNKPISVSSFLHDNIIPYFPTVDLPQDNTYIQQNQNYQPSTFSHNFPSTFQNNTYTANSFIPTTTITSTYNFMHDVNHDYDLFPTITKDKNCGKNINKTPREQQCPTTPKKSKRKHSNDLPGFVDFPFLSMPGSINSPILPDDFHTHTGFLQPPTPQLYPCKNPFTKSNELGSGSLLPLPPVPGTRSNIQHPEISPVNNAGTSLTNFNLSTIFPEINNKGALDAYAEPRVKENTRSYTSTVQVSFNDKPTFSLSYINSSTSQTYSNQ